MSGVLRLGDRAVLVTGILTHDVAELVKVCSEHFPDYGARAGIDSLLIEASVPTTSLEVEVEQWVAALGPQVLADQGSAGGRTVVIPVSYAGADLKRIARELDVTPEEWVIAHTDVLWEVVTLGFAPGFPYLVPHRVSPEQERLFAVPRLASPREKVPAGAVAVAAGMSAVYPSVMPGGWNLVGTTEVSLFEVSRNPVTLVEPGDLVRFEALA